MMLMLVLGHALALTKSVNSLIEKVTKYCSNTANAAAIISFLTIIVSLFNWGLGLIFGAIFARKVGEHASRKNIKLNYPLIGAAGYSGMMVWHGGLSGSAPIKVAEQGHLSSLLSNSDFSFPEMISLSETIFSNMNLVIISLLLLFLPLGLYFIGKRNQGKIISISSEKIESDSTKIDGAEKLDHSFVFVLIIGIVMISYSVSHGLKADNGQTTSSLLTSPLFFNEK